jgi:hypothetical protein
MSTLATAFLVFLCCSGAALAGVMLHRKLPVHHLDGDSKDVVKLVMGLIATMAALVLGLLIASAKSSYDTQETELQQVATTIVQLDRMLELYGADARDARGSLRTAVTAALERVWPAHADGAVNLAPSATRYEANTLYSQVQSLSPTTEGQRHAQSAALELGASLGQMRVLMFEQLGRPVQWPLLVVLVFWVSVLFLGFGLLARFNVTVAVALTLGALSVASAIFMMLELSDPYGGLMRISDAPLRAALAQMGG